MKTGNDGVRWLFIRRKLGLYDVANTQHIADARILDFVRLVSNTLCADGNGRFDCSQICLCPGHQRFLLSQPLRMLLGRMDVSRTEEDTRASAVSTRLAA